MERKFTWVTGLGDRETYGEANNSVLLGIENPDWEKIEGEARDRGVSLVDWIAEGSQWELPLELFVNFFEDPTTDTLMHMMLALIPGAVFDTDNEGQIVMYTNLLEGQGGELLSFEDVKGPYEPFAERVWVDPFPDDEDPPEAFANRAN